MTSKPPALPEPIPVDPSLLGQPVDKFLADPFPTYAHWHAQPGSFAPEMNDTIVFTRHADILAALRNPAMGTFVGHQTRSMLAAVRGTQANTVFAEKLRQLLEKGLVCLDRWLFAADPPDHARVRGAMAHSFQRHTLEAMRPRVQAIVDERLDRVQAAGRMDILADLAVPTSVAVIADVIGVPQRDTEKLLGWMSNISSSLELFGGEERQQGALMSASLCRDYFLDLAAKRQAAPGDGLLDKMLEAQRQGQWSLEDVAGNCMAIFFAGQETVGPMMANGLRALLSQPGHWEMLRARPELVPTAIDELVRFDGPIHMIRRQALADTRVNGIEVKAGKSVACMLGAGNRDPRVFAEPDRLDLTRRPVMHLAFGQGIHFCLGMPLARLEAEVMLGSLLERMPGLALEDAPQQWARTLPVRRPAALRVRY